MGGCLECSTTTTCTRTQPPQPLSIALTSTIKSPTSNSVAFTFTVTPLPEFNPLDFSQMFSTNLTNVTSTTFSSDGNGGLTVVVSYSASIQGQNVNVNLDPSLVGGFYTGIISAQANFEVDPNNNIPANYYENPLYRSVVITNVLAEVVLSAALGIFIAGLFTARFIGVEMIGVVQAAFAALIMISIAPPLLARLSRMVYNNGYNIISQGTQYTTHSSTLPSRIADLSYWPSLAQNLNYTLVALLLPLLVALGLYIASRRIKDHIPKKGKLYRWAMLALN